MKKNILWIIGVVIAVLLFIGAYFLYNNLSEKYDSPSLTESSSQSETESKAEEYKAPDFTVTDADGKKVRLSDYFGKPIVLNFWASWCPPCKAEMPHFEDAFKENDDIQFLMVNMTDGSRETVEIAKEFIRGEKYTFPVFYDTEFEAATNYGASSLPVTFFIDKSGNLVTYAVGMISKENLEQGIGLIK